MNRLLIFISLFILFNTSDLQSGEIPAIQLDAGQNAGFRDVHGWPGGRCSICHISPSPGAESAALINPDISRLCESCHKGTVTILPSARLKTSVQKMDNHPIKFSPLDFAPDKINHVIVKENNQFYVSGKTGKVPIFGASAATAVVECATCHDSHGKLNMPKMPRINNSRSELCLVCHLIDIKIPE
ncbi:MAG: hypothetical protein HZC49_07060 [Nitrospirae bacterium]|nr:hypothetical protein [Nitrospirota bacterium]